MKHKTWKTIKLVRGYILLRVNGNPSEHVPEWVHKEFKSLRDDVERQVSHDRDNYIVGTNPIRDEGGLTGWVIIAAPIGRFEVRMNNIISGLA